MSQAQATTDSSVDPRSNLLLQGIVAVLDSIKKNHPSLEGAISSVTTHCRASIASGEFSTAYNQLKELGKLTHSAILSERSKNESELISLVNKFSSFNHGVLTKEHERTLLSLKRKLKTGEMSFQDASSELGALVTDITETVDALASRNYGSAEVKSNVYSEGTEKVLQADLAVATRRVSRDLERLSSLLAKQYPTDEEVLALRGEVLGLKEKGKTKFFESLDVLSRISWAIHRINDVKMDQDKQYLTSLAGQFQNMASGLKEQADLNGKSSELLSKFEDEIGSMMGDLEDSGRNSDNLADLKAKMLAKIGQMQEAMSAFVADQGEIIDSQSKQIENQEKQITTMRTSLDTAQKELALTSKEVFTDALSGISNRRGYESKVQQVESRWVENRKTTSIIVIDVDHFKSVNDNYGHQVGDQVINWMGRIMKRVKKSYPNTYVARYGGEEFVIVAEETTAQESAEIARKVRKTIEYHQFVSKEGDVKINLTASLGMAFFRNKNDTAEHVFELADKALYKAKDGGRNAVWISKSENEQLKLSNKK